MNPSRSQSCGNGSLKSLALFEQKSDSDIAPGSLNDDLLVRAAITASIKRSEKSREQIADSMSRFLGLKVSARMLAAFTAESKELHRWPGAWDRAFCAAVDDDELLRCRVELAGFHVITDDEFELLRLGREYLRQKRATEQVALLEKRLQGMVQL